MEKEKVGADTAKNFKLKYSRILRLYTRLMNGEVVSKAEEAEKYGVADRSVQRDIENLRGFLAESGREIVYDHRLNGYYLKPESGGFLSGGEFFAVAEILIGSRALRKCNLAAAAEKLAVLLPAGEREEALERVNTALGGYTETRCKKNFIEMLPQMEKAARDRRTADITYESGGELTERRIRPAGVFFSEYYFYLAAFADGNEDGEPFPEVFRADRIRSFDAADETFEEPFADITEETLFRKRMQYVSEGRSRKIKFWYSGEDFENVLDKLPLSRVLGHCEKGYLISAEVYGGAAEEWLKSRGALLEVRQ